MPRIDARRVGQARPEAPRGGIVLGVVQGSTASNSRGRLLCGIGSCWDDGTTARSGTGQRLHVRRLQARRGHRAAWSGYGGRPAVRREQCWCRTKAVRSPRITVRLGRAGVRRPFEFTGHGIDLLGETVDQAGSVASGNTSRSTRGLNSPPERRTSRAAWYGLAS